MDKPKTCKGKRRDGTPCQSPFVMDNGYCRIHGGKAPRGKANGNYKHGRYSRYAPASALGELYERAQQDTDLRDLKDDLALSTALINSRLQNLDTQTGIDFYADLKRLTAELKKGLRKQDLEDIAEIAFLIDGLADRGIAQFKELETIIKLIEQRRKLSDSQSRHENEQMQFITITQAMALLNMLVSVMFEHIQSSHTKQLIYQAFEKILNERFPSAIETLVISD